MQQIATEYLARRVQVRVTVSQMRLETEHLGGGTVGALNDQRAESSTIDLRTTERRSRTRPAIPIGALGQLR